MPEDIYKKFQLAKQKGMVREINQHFELQMIQEKFAKCKIDNIALKGSFLKKYYPYQYVQLLKDKQYKKRLFILNCYCEQLYQKRKEKY